MPLASFSRSLLHGCRMAAAGPLGYSKPASPFPRAPRRVLEPAGRALLPVAAQPLSHFPKYRCSRSYFFFSRSTMDIHPRLT
jgi:hypothetical protein